MASDASLLAPAVLTLPPPPLGVVELLIKHTNGAAECAGMAPPFEVKICASGLTGSRPR